MKGKKKIKEGEQVNEGREEKGVERGGEAPNRAAEERRGEEGR